MNARAITRLPLALAIVGFLASALPTPVRAEDPLYREMFSTLSLSIGQGTMTITGSGYPPNSTVNVTLTNLNTTNSTTIVKTADASGTLQPGGLPLGTLSASPGNVIQATTPAPNAATTTAVVPAPPATGGGLIEALRKLIGIIIELLPG